MASSMVFIDGTAVNVSLPVMQRELQATAEGLQWIVESYTLFLSALLLVGGTLGDRFGRRLIFALGVGVFTLSSLLCALAPRLDLLIAARCMQGIGAALATPESLALITAAYSGEERGRAIGTWSGFSAITTAIGPLLGGWLTQTFTWRAVFLINLPLGVAVVVIAMLRVPESRDDSAPRRVDAIGAGLATLGLAAIVYGLIRLQTASSDGAGVTTALAGLFVLACFVVYERFVTQEPMIRPDLFASPAFTGANLYTLLLYAALGGSLYFIPFDLINVQGYSPLAAGASLLPFILIMFGASRWSGGLVARIGPRIPLVIGALLAAAGFCGFALPSIAQSYWTSFFPATVVLGAGGAFFVAPLTTTVMDAAPVREASIASGINNAVSRMAGLIAIAGLGLALASTFHNRLAAELQNAGVAPSTAALVRRQEDTVLSGRAPALPASSDRERATRAIGLAYVAGFREAMLVSATLSLAAAAIAGFWNLRAPLSS